MSQTTKRRSIRFGKEAPAASIRTGSKSTTDLRQLSLNSYFNAPKSLPMSTSTASKRVIDHPRSQKTHPVSTTAPTTSTASQSQADTQILKGVVACLDIRTDDGDDASENFERVLQTMGAKTRRTFSDSVTHLVFKNGSNATLKKALSKKAHIVSLLWITRCKREGRRLEEKDFLIESPQGIVLAGKKKRKSMEPGKVKALNEEDVDKGKRKRSRSSTGSELSHRHSAAHEYRPSSLSTSVTNADPTSSSSTSTTDSSSSTNDTDHGSPEKTKEQRHKDDIAERVRRELEGEDLSLSPPASPVLSKPRLSTAALERKRHLAAAEEMDHVQKPAITEEMRARNEQIKAQIKADFFVGSVEPSPKSARTSISSSTAPLVRRKRRSLSNNLSKPTNPLPSSNSAIPTNTTTAAAASSQLDIIDNNTSSDTNESAYAVKTRSSNPKPTIVFTSMTKEDRDRCAAIVRNIGVHEIGKAVDERTTHVIVGQKRRTVSVLYCLLYGAWLVKPSWIFDSERNKSYLPEFSYEAIEYFPEAPRARRRQPFLPSNLHIFVHSAHILDTSSLKALIHKAKGRTVNSIGEADIIISRQALETDKISINENWILDCIEQWRYLPTEPYRIHKGDV